jgi:hypothetical protein
MQAAVVSILLMVGACGAPGTTDVQSNSPAAGAAARQSTAPSQVTVRPAQYAVDVNCPDSEPVNYAYPTNECQGCCLCQRFHTVVCPWYSPVWLMHGNAEFYPGNYARHYDYREKFDYPWNGPRPAGYAQFGGPHAGPSQFGPGQFVPPGSEEIHRGAPRLEPQPPQPMPPDGDISATGGPALRPAGSIATAHTPSTR